MPDEELIIAEEFCASHKIEFSFVSLLKEFDLLEVTIIDNKSFISESQLPKLEKLVRLYYDLNINLEGIDVIANLLERLNKLNEENHMLKARLRLYEGDEAENF